LFQERILPSRLSPRPQHQADAHSASNACLDRGTPRPVPGEFGAGEERQEYAGSGTVLISRAHPSTAVDAPSFLVIRIEEKPHAQVCPSARDSLAANPCRPDAERCVEPRIRTEVGARANTCVSGVHARQEKIGAPLSADRWAVILRKYRRGRAEQQSDRGNGDEPRARRHDVTGEPGRARWQRRNPPPRSAWRRRR
jgi:hypothetical protein